jgi:hypothetical protein
MPWDGCECEWQINDGTECSAQESVDGLVRMQCGKTTNGTTRQRQNTTFWPHHSSFNNQYTTAPHNHQSKVMLQQQKMPQQQQQHNPAVPSTLPTQTETEFFFLMGCPTSMINALARRPKFSNGEEDVVMIKYDM